VRPSIADHDVGADPHEPRMRAFAIAHAHAAVGSYVREAQGPTVAALPDELIGIERQIETGRLQHGLDQQVQPVGYHRDTRAMATAQRDELRKARVYLHRSEEHTSELQ